MMIQRVLNETAWATRLTPEDFRALSPLIYGHISPYGTFRLDMKRRLDLELPADTFPAKPVIVPQGKRREDPQLALFDATL
jgi:Tn3 transposase DDE domain